MTVDEKTKDLRKLKNSLSEVVEEYIRLKQFKEDMLAAQPFKPGDRVALSDSILTINYDQSYGWRHYKQILRPGNTGTVTSVEWNTVHKYWSAGVALDVEWHQSEFAKQLAEPVTHIWVSQRPAVFYLSYRYVRPAIVGYDSPIYPPKGADKYEWINMPNPPPYTKETTYGEIMQHFEAKVKQ